MKTHSLLSIEEEPSCQSVLSPPVNSCATQAPMANTAGATAATANEHPQSDARESSERLCGKGGEQ